MGFVYSNTHVSEVLSLGLTTETSAKNVGVRNQVGVSGTSDCVATNVDNIDTKSGV